MFIIYCAFKSKAHMEKITGLMYRELLRAQEPPMKFV